MKCLSELKMAILMKFSQVFGLVFTLGSFKILF